MNTEELDARLHAALDEIDELMTAAQQGQVQGWTEAERRMVWAYLEVAGFAVHQAVDLVCTEGDEGPPADAPA